MKHKGYVAQKQRSYTAIIVLIMAVLVAGLYWTIQRYEQDAQTSFVNQESLRLNAEAQRFRDTLQVHVQDAVALGKLAAESGTQAAISEALRILITTDPSYLQGSFINESGDEFVRWQRTGSSAQSNEITLKTPTGEDLESQHNQSYFKDTIALNQGDVYVSAIELNRARGEVQRPLTPTYRVAVRTGGSLPGLVVLTVDAAPLLASVRQSARITGGRVQHFLIDSRGNWLVGPEPDLEWASDLLWLSEPIHSTLDDAKPPVYAERWLLMSAASGDALRPPGLMFTTQGKVMLGLIILAVTGLLLRQTRKEGTFPDSSPDTSPATSADTDQTELARSPRESTTRSFSGIKALVVDDVDLNCEVVALFLAAMGIDTRSAATGEQAMDALNGESIDLIFMDLQLDGETGQALTRSIRRRNAKQPIIIGMSASLSDTDRTSAMASGMDAFLAKPFQQDDIQKIVRQCFAEGKTLWQSDIATPNQPQNTEDLPEFMQPERARELALWNHSLLLQCLRSYSNSCRETLEQLHQTDHARDTPKVLHFSHRIRGAAASIGDNEMQQRAKQLDLRARQNSEAGTASEGAAIASLARQRISQIQIYLDHHCSEDETLVSGTEDVESALQRLRLRMSTNRVADVEDIAVVTGFLLAKGREETANELRQAIERYDFARALNLLELETLIQT